MLDPVLPLATAATADERIECSGREKVQLLAEQFICDDCAHKNQ